MLIAAHMPMRTAWAMWKGAGLTFMIAIDGWMYVSIVRRIDFLLSSSQERITNARVSKD